MRMLGGIDKINARVGRLTSWIVMVSVVTIVFEVISRYLFNSPTRWSSELNMYLLCGYIFLGGGYTLLDAGHVKIDVFYVSRSDKTKAILDVVTSVLFFAFIIVLLWQLGEMTITSIRTGRQSSESMQWPLWPVQIVMIIGTFLILLQGIVKLVRDIRKIVKGDK